MQIVWCTISVKDLEASKAFYRDIMGLRPGQEIRHPGTTINFFEADSGAQIELIGGNDTSRTGSGQLTIGFAVEDLDKTYAEMQSKGIEVSEIVKAGPTTKFFFISDPDGVRIQLVEK